MTRITGVLTLFIISGCVVFGKRTIHSPSSESGVLLKERHVHGGALKNSPPDAIIFINEADSVGVRIHTKPVSEKSNWGGIFLPIFPLFLIPKKTLSNNLTIEIELASTSKGVVYLDSLELKLDWHTIKPIIAETQGNTVEFSPSKNFRELTGQGAIQIEFDISAEVELVTLIPNGIYCGDKEVRLPFITFRKMKQKWRFIGP